MLYNILIITFTDIYRRKNIIIIQVRVEDFNFLFPINNPSTMHVEQYIQHKFQRQYLLNFTIQEVPHQFKSIQNSYKCLQ